METVAHSRWSFAGMLLGALALMVTVFHFTAGPFSPKPTLENVVAARVSAIKKGIVAGLKGEVPQGTAKQEMPDIDSALDMATIGSGIVALLCAFIGGMRKESRWSTGAALAFGGATLAFHAVLFGFALVCLILLLLLILSLLNAVG